MSLEIPGCFAMTETGPRLGRRQHRHHRHLRPRRPRSSWSTRRSGPRGRTTSATPPSTAWPPSSSPSWSRKGVNHGVHAFYVDLRDPETKEFLPGIGGEDDGVKGGLNGIDNGRLHFTHVRDPAHQPAQPLRRRRRRRQLHAPPSPARAAASSPCSAPWSRAASPSTAPPSTASKLALKTAIQYATERRQFNASSQTDEEVLLDYQRHQRRLFTRLATTYAASFAQRAAAAEVRRRLLRPRTTPTRTARTSRPSPRPSSRSAPGTPWTPCRNAARPAAAPAS